MFKKLYEFSYERGGRLLTVRCTHAWLEEDTLYVDINEDNEILTNSRERRVHFETVDTEWLQKQIVDLSHPKTIIATPEHPIEVLAADVCPLLEIEGNKYVLSFYRDITPLGWLVPGGCPRNFEEIETPQITAGREAVEEILIADTKGKVFSLPDSKVQLEENLNAWNLAPSEIVPLSVQELAITCGDAQNLVIRMGEKKTRIENINVTIDRFIASITITLYWRIKVPVKLSELRIFDCESSGAKPLNRAARLTDKDGKVVALYSFGNNILDAPWMNPQTEKRATLPLSK